jgi:predicted metal-binding protein
MAKENLRREAAPAECAVVFICEKCGKGADFSGRDLKQEIRARLKEDGRKGEVRVVLSSCLDLCPKDGITVAVASTARSKPTSFFVARGDSGEAASAVLSEIF